MTGKPKSLIGGGHGNALAVVARASNKGDLWVREPEVVGRSTARARTSFGEIDPAITATVILPHLVL